MKAFFSLTCGGIRVVTRNRTGESEAPRYNPGGAQPERIEHHLGGRFHVPRII